MNAIVVKLLATLKLVAWSSHGDEHTCYHVN